MTVLWHQTLQSLQRPSWTTPEVCLERPGLRGVPGHDDIRTYACVFTHRLPFFATQEQMSAIQRAGVYVYQDQIEGQGVLRIMQCLARFIPFVGSRALGMFSGSTLLIRAVRDCRFWICCPLPRNLARSTLSLAKACFQRSRWQLRSPRLTPRTRKLISSA